MGSRRTLQKLLLLAQAASVDFKGGRSALRDIPTLRESDLEDVERRKTSLLAFDWKPQARADLTYRHRC